jgi:hypothetical protein
MPFTVMVEENSDYGSRYTHGEFVTWEKALAECRRIVDADLDEQLEPGMQAGLLITQYRFFGRDPYILGDGPGGQRFSAWDYAEERAIELTTPGGPADQMLTIK